jgi:thymidylate synthase
MQQYLALMRNVLEHGARKHDRTGTGTCRCSASDALRPGRRIPLVTTKKLHVKSIIHELLWFLQGATNVRTCASTA